MELPKDVPVFIVKMSTEDNRNDFDNLLSALLDAKMKIKNLEEENKRLKFELEIIQETR